MNTFPIFTTGTTLTSTGTAVTDLIPLDSAGATPRYIRVTATASGYFRIGRDTTAAVAGDMMVQPGDAVHLAVPGCLWFSFISVSGSARVTVSPLEIGSWDKRTNQWSLDLNFTRGALDPRITFTRASSATFTNSAGLVASAATNAPRFDYDPVTLQPKGLLIEEARTNLLTYSEQFDNTTGWSLYLTSASANSIAAPDGTVTADLLTATTSGGFIGNLTGGAFGVSVTASTVYTSSFYIKQNAAGTNTRLVIYDGPSLVAKIADTYIYWSGTVPSIGTNSGWNSTPTITAVGNGWYRVVGSVNSGIYTRITVLIYPGALNESVYIWGAQLEAGAFATSYIPTVAAQATRAAENAVMTGTNFSSWYNATEGTLFAEAKNTGTAANWYAQMSTDSNFNNRIVLASSGTNFIVSDSLASNQALLGNYDNSNTLVKAAGAYAVNNFAYTQNGLSALSSASGNLGTPTLMTIGYRNPSTPVGYINGHIKRITYWPRRLSNAELQAVTS